MEMCFSNSGTENYIEVKLGYRREIKDWGNSYKISMLQENSIPGIITPVLTETDGIIKLNYSISSYYIMERLIKCMKMDGMLFSTIVSQLIKTIKQIEDYMISSDDLVISPQYMMFDSANSQLWLLCIPGYNHPVKEQLKSFIEYLMRYFDYRDINGMSYLYELYRIITENNNGIENFIKVVEQGTLVEQAGIITYDKENRSFDDKTFDIEESKIKTHTAIEEGHSNKLVGVSFCIAGFGLLLGILWFGYRYFGQNQGERNLFFMLCCLVGIVILISVSIVFGRELLKTNSEYTNLENFEGKGLKEIYEGNGLEVETDINMQTNYSYNTGCTINALIPLTNARLEPLNFNFGGYNGNKIVIGRAYGTTDYMVNKNEISRYHANIYNNGDGKYYLEDNDSSNGTYVNSKRLKKNQLCRLNPGDIVRFADEDFYVS